MFKKNFARSLHTEGSLRQIFTVVIFFLLELLKLANRQNVSEFKRELGDLPSFSLMLLAVRVSISKEN